MAVIKMCTARPVGLYCITITLNCFTARFVETLLKFDFVAIAKEEVIFRLKNRHKLRGTCNTGPKIEWK